MHTVVVRFSMQLPAVITKKDKWFVASCPVLDIFTQGETEKRAKKNLADALSLFFISCHERGTLDAILKKCGFRPASPSEYAEHSLTSDYVNVPIPFIVDWDNRRRCHA